MARKLIPPNSKMLFEIISGPTEDRGAVFRNRKTGERFECDGKGWNKVEEPPNKKPSLKPPDKKKPKNNKLKGD